jgi:hypothetical protein
VQGNPHTPLGKSGLDEQARSLERLRIEAQQMKDEAEQMQRRAQTEMAKKEDEMQLLKATAKNREGEMDNSQQQLDADQNVLLTLNNPSAQNDLDEQARKLEHLRIEAQQMKDEAEQLQRRAKIEMAKKEDEMRLLKAEAKKREEEMHSALLIVTVEKAAALEKKHHDETRELQQTQQATIEKLMQEMNSRDAKLAQMDMHKRQLEKEFTHVIKSKDAEIARTSEQKKETEKRMSIKEQEAKQMEEERLKLELEIRNAKGASEKTQEAFYREQALRKKYLHELEQAKGAIRVFCRVRPLSSSEKEMNSKNCTNFPDEQAIQLKPHNGAKGKSFNFDKVYGPDSNQEEIFQQMVPLVQSAVDGYNVCIFAYGQTGSGKTYTMENPGGSPSAEGITPRAVAELFRIKEKDADRFDIAIRFSMLELYNDKLVDLIENVGQKLTVKKDSDGMTYVENASVREVCSADELKEIIRLGGARRHVSSTTMNAESSRSHLIMSVVVESNKRGTNDGTVGKLTLVDLAGSERQSKTGSENEALVEAQSINKSLSALGDVVHALTTKAKFIPYRNNLVSLWM